MRTALSKAALAAALTLAACGTTPNPDPTEGPDASVVPNDATLSLTKQKCEEMHPSLDEVQWTCGEVVPPMNFTGETFSCSSAVDVLPTDSTKCAIKCTGVFGWHNLSDPTSIQISADGLHFNMEDPPKPWGCRRQ